MSFQEFVVRLLGIARTLQSWHGALLVLDGARRDKLASYADEISATFARAAQAFATLETNPQDRTARRDAVREFGRISGYLDDIVVVLQQALDGRKIAGLKRRLSRLAQPGARSGPRGISAADQITPRLDTLLDAEGYFRALADGLRATSD